MKSKRNRLTKIIALVIVAAMVLTSLSALIVMADEESVLGPAAIGFDISVGETYEILVNKGETIEYPKDLEPEIIANDDESFAYAFTFTKTGTYTITILTEDNENGVVYEITVIDNDETASEPTITYKNTFTMTAGKTARFDWTGKADIAWPDEVEVFSIDYGGYEPDSVIEPWGIAMFTCEIPGSYEIILTYAETGDIDIYPLIVYAAEPDPDDEGEEVKVTVNETFTIVVPAGGTISLDDGISIVDTAENDDGSQIYSLTAKDEGEYVIYVSDAYMSVFKYVVIASDVNDTEPDDTEPDDTEPGIVEPDDPDETDPNTTEPEITEPGIVEPDSTEPDTTEPEDTEPGSIEQKNTDPDTTNSGSDTSSNNDDTTETVTNTDIVDSTDDGTKNDEAAAKTGEDNTLFWAFGGLGIAVAAGAYIIYRRRKM